MHKLSFALCFGVLFYPMGCFSAPPVSTPQNRAAESFPEAPQRPMTDQTHEILSLIENQMADIQSHQIEQAYERYTSNQFKIATSLEEFTYFINGYPEFSKNKNAFFGNIEPKPEGVFSIQGTLISTTGDSMNVEYDLVKEEGSWKIIGIKVFPIKKKLNPLEKKNENPIVPTK
jgi:hypothetical protein